MLSLNAKVTLYHGSCIPVEVPNLIQCRPRKDFGRGFYVTSSRTQAESFAQTVARRTNRIHPDSTQGFGILSQYGFKPNKNLRVKVFPHADAEWLRCVAAHKGAKALDEIVRSLSSYDVIVGKVANDQTNATILAYMGGLYGEIGDATADRTCIKLLLPNRLDNQACFRTTKALACLSYRGSEQIWL